MISKVTIFSLVLTLLLAAGIVRWNLGHSDDCTRYFKGEKGYGPTTNVSAGPRQIPIPCTFWLPRQPAKIQILCLLDLLLGVVFVLNALADAQRTIHARRARAGLTHGVRAPGAVE